MPSDWKVVESLQYLSSSDLMEELYYIDDINDDPLPHSIEVIVKEYKNNKKLSPTSRFELIMWLASKG